MNSPTTPHAHADSHHGAETAPHGSLKGYVTGFLLSVLLTAIPFYVVMNKSFTSSSTTALVVLAFAAVQIVVHMVYFLHMNTKTEGGWSMLALVFTAVLVVITLSGSIWVMYHLDHNMMPGMMEEPTQQSAPLHHLSGTPASSTGPGTAGMSEMRSMPHSK